MPALSQICIWELFLNTRLEAIVTSAYGRRRQVQGATFSFHFLAFRTTKTYKWGKKNMSYSITFHQVKTKFKKNAPDTFTFWNVSERCARATDSVVRMVSVGHGRISGQQQPSPHNARPSTTVPHTPYCRLKQSGQVTAKLALLTEMQQINTPSPSATTRVYCRAPPLTGALHFPGSRTRLDKGPNSAQLTGQWCECILGWKGLAGVPLFDLVSVYQ